MAICKNCGQKYSRWTTPVSAKGVCRSCFEAELGIPSQDRTALSAKEPGLQNPTAPMMQVEDTRPLPVMAVMDRRSAKIGPRSFVPRSRSKVVFVLAMACYCVTLSYFIGTWASAVHLKRPPREFYLKGDMSDVFGLLIFAPLVESLMLVGVFELLRKFRAPETIQMLVSALFISEMHVWPWWPHAVIVFPSFYIQVGCYLYWRHRGSWKQAYWILTGIHALNNVIPAIGVVGRGLFRYG